MEKLQIVIWILFLLHPCKADDFPDDDSTMVFLKIGDTISGQKETSGDQDWFKAILVAGRQYTVVNKKVGSSDDPYLIIKGPSPSTTQLAANDDCCGSPQASSRIYFTPTSTGIYFLIATMWGSTTGTYILTIASEGSCSASCSCKFSKNYFCNFIACSPVSAPCSSPCASSNICNACSGGLVALGGDCLASCPNGSYNNGGVCTYCTTINSECLSCSDSTTCTSCTNSKKAFESSCVSSCPAYTYLNSGNCIRCSTLDSDCLTCSGASSCSSCNNGKLIYGATCVVSCPVGTYNNGGICTACITLNTDCNTCTSSTICTACNGGKYAYGAACYVTCPAGTYSGTTTCISCSTLHSNCNSCSSSTSCISCSGGLYAYISTCYATCPTGTYTNGGSCISCSTLNSDCNECSSSSVCTLCGAGLFAYGATCVASCPVGTYTNGGICTLCTTLNTYCSSCLSATSCTSCIGSRFGYGPNCVNPCPTNTYTDTAVCIDCSSLNPSCSTCTNSTFCTSCTGGLLAYGSTCVVSCPTGTYNNAGICTSCSAIDFSCIVCTSSSLCNECSGGLYAYQDFCLAICPPDTYSSTKVCIDCWSIDPYCTSCTNSTLCNSCSSGKLAYRDSCLDSCPVDTYEENGVCIDCYTLDSSCIRCVDSSSCSACSGGKLVYGAACVVTCPFSYYDNTNICTSCLSLNLYCESCSNSSVCISCLSDRYAYEASCLTTCPSNTYAKEKTCIECSTLDAYCTTCIDSTICSTCSGGKLVYGSNCVISCPSGYYNNSGTCLPIPATSEIQGTIAQVLATTLTAGSFILLGSSQALTAGLLAKIIAYIRYLNIDYSPELKNLFDQPSSFVALNLIPDLPEVIQERIPSVEIPYMFEDYGLEAPFLVNFWPNLFTITIALMIFIASIILQKIFSQTQRKVFISLVRKLYFAALNFLIIQVYCSFDEITLYFILQVKFLSFNSGFSYLSLILSLFFTGIGIGSLGYHIFILFNYQKCRQKDLVNKTNDVDLFTKKYEGFGMLYQDFKDNSLLLQSYLFLFILRNILANIVIGIIYQYPVIQTILFVIYSFLLVGYLVLKAPFNKKLDLLEQIFYEGIILATNLSVFVMSLKQANGTLYDVRESLGKGIITMSLLFNIGAFVLVLLRLLIHIYTAINKWRRKKSQGRLSKRNLLNKRYPKPLIQKFSQSISHLTSSNTSRDQNLSLTFSRDSDHLTRMRENFKNKSHLRIENTVHFFETKPVYNTNILSLDDSRISPILTPNLDQETLFTNNLSNSDKTKNKKKRRKLESQLISQSFLSHSPNSITHKENSQIKFEDYKEEPVLSQTSFKLEAFPANQGYDRNSRDFLSNFSKRKRISVLSKQESKSQESLENCIEKDQFSFNDMIGTFNPLESVERYKKQRGVNNEMRRWKLQRAMIRDRDHNNSSQNLWNLEENSVSEVNL